MTKETKVAIEQMESIGIGAGKYPKEIAVKIKIFRLLNDYEFTIGEAKALLTEALDTIESTTDNLAFTIKCNGYLGSNF